MALASSQISQYENVQAAMNRLSSTGHSELIHLADEAGQAVHTAHTPRSSLFNTPNGGTPRRVSQLSLQPETGYVHVHACVCMLSFSALAGALCVYE